MNAKDIKAKKAAIRREIKERMQRDLEECKKKIKKRIGYENISMEEKRLKYRHEVDREKHRLMLEAKEEFRARKRMLGLSPDQEIREEPQEEPIATPAPDVEEELSFSEEDELLEPQHGISPKDAFIYDDKGDTDIRREYESPIGTQDAMPPETTPRPIIDSVAPGAEEMDAFETPGLMHYIVNLVFHPVQTLEEFDEYLTSPSGILKVMLFYLVSLLPIVLFVLLGESTLRALGGGVVGSHFDSAMSGQFGITVMVGQTVLKLLLFSLIIAIVNYFVTDKANFLMLTAYFAFVEGVTRVFTYVLILSAVIAGFAAVAATPLMAVIGVGIGLLLIAFLIWTVALSIIVLINVYGYGTSTAILLVLGAIFLRWMTVKIVVDQVGLYIF